MHHFLYRDKQLYGEEVPIERIAKDVGTPFYLYSYATLRNHFLVFENAFKEVSHIICFSVKANSNIAVLKVFVREGGGCDVVSGGELARALTAGVDPKKVVYSGVGKTVDEIKFALHTDILMFNIESLQELEVISEVAQQIDKVARISLRINPDVDSKTHPYISTGLKKYKFGIDVKVAQDSYSFAKSLKNIDIVGVDCHIGSQITELEPFVDALKSLKKLIGVLRKDGFNIRYLDLGGGLGITYDTETPPHPNLYAAAIVEQVRDLGVIVVLEPGRVITGNAGILVTEVLYTKKMGEKNFIIVDAGMNDLLRPSLYDAYHGIQPVHIEEREKIKADIVGPICESGDFFARDRIVPHFKRKDIIAIMSAGAYGFTMSSNYNSRSRIPEVMVNGDQYYIIRHREEYCDLIKGEHIPEFLSQ